MLSKQSLIGTVAVALLVVTAGCSAVVTDSGTPDAEQIADKVQERTDEIDSVRGEKVTTIQRGGETNETVTRFVQRPPNESWSEVVSADTAYQSAGDRVVRSDGRIVSYDASENNYTVLETDFAAGPGQMISAEAIERTLNRSDVSFEGTDTVAGRDVYVVSLDSDSEAGTSNTTLKVDQEYWYPLEYTTTSQFGDTEMTVMMTHRSVTFNEPVADDRFSFDPPEGATLEESTSVGSETFDSVERLDAATEFDVPTPSVPDGYTFESANTFSTDGNTSASVVYTNDTDARLRYSVSPATDAGMDGETVTVGSTEVTVADFGSSTRVAWTCGDTQYALTGELDREQLLGLVESVDC